MIVPKLPNSEVKLQVTYNVNIQEDSAGKLELLSSYLMSSGMEHPEIFSMFTYITHLR